MAAGVIASTFAVTPTERLKTVLIDDARNRQTQRFKGPMHAGLTIYNEKGIRGLWAGWTSTTMKQAGATAMRLGTYNVLKDYESVHGWQSSTALNFFNGAVAGTVTTLVTQPVDVLKTRAQSMKGAGIAEAVSEIWKNGGLSGFWRGTTMRLGRTVISGGVLFTVNEWAVEVLRPFLGAKE
jgi:solute carrier family 25 citrate transporter 1